MAGTGKRNPIKTLLIVVLILLVISIVLSVVWKDKVVIEDEQGQTYVGSAGKFVSEGETE